MAKKKGDEKEPQSKYFAEFKKHFEEIDELAQSILKGHLIIEGAVDNIITLMFFHPELVLKARLGFSQKMEIVRAYALQQNESILGGCSAIPGSTGAINDV